MISVALVQQNVKTLSFYLKMLGLYLDTLIISHKFRNMLSG